MSIQQMLQQVSERVSTSATVRNVYGNPVVVGSRTVIPAATVKYAFGGGGGPKRNEGEAGGGGGGRMSAQPCGALEITQQGTRFIAFDDRKRLGVAMALGFVVGAVVMMLAGPKRIEIVKKET